MSVDLMFLAHNRLAFTVASMDALLDNTNWESVRYLYIVDDNSIDGTYEYLTEVNRLAPTSSSFISGKYGGPVAAMNEVLDRTDATVLAKIDNDLIVPPGWLDTMLEVLDDNPQLDAIGMEPGFAGFVEPINVKRTYLPARWIGGQGLFRTRVFANRRPKARERWFGLTQFQRKHVNAGWVDPDIPAFNLDHLPVEPWRSFAAEYVERGWSRAWSPYSPAMRQYWLWWTAQQQAVA